MVRQFERIVRQVAAPLTQEEMDSVNATHAEATQLMISSLGPPPIGMDHQEYMNWANQQTIELFPGVVLPISMITAPITEEEMDFLNAKMAEFAPLNAQIIDEPRWYLSGVHRSRIDLKGIASESYQCSDGYWRILEGDQLESARRRTTNLQAPTRAAIPRPAALQTPVHQTAALQTPVHQTAALQTPVHQTAALQTPVHQTAALQTPVHQTAALQTPVVRATAHDAPVANGQFGNAFSQTAHFQ